MFRLSNVLLFTSLDKCCGDGLFSSDNGTYIFWGYTGVSTLLVDLFKWSFSVGFSLELKKNDIKTDKWDEEQKRKAYI